MAHVVNMDLCRLCLVKEKVLIPIFGEDTSLHIFQKITSCLPVKVDKNDKLPKNICDLCFVKVENVYQFWNSTAKAEKQLYQWLDETETSESNSNCSTVIKIEQVLVKEEEEEEEEEEEQEQESDTSDVTNCWNNVEVKLEDDMSDLQKNEDVNSKIDVGESIEIENSESDNCEELEHKVPEMVLSTYDELHSLALQEQQISNNVVTPVELCTNRSTAVPTCSWQLTPPSSSLHFVNMMMYQYQNVEQEQNIAMTKSISLQTPVSVQLDSRSTILEEESCNKHANMNSNKNDSANPKEITSNKSTEDVNSVKTVLVEKVQPSTSLQELNFSKFILEINKKIKSKMSMNQMSSNKNDSSKSSATTMGQSETICELCDKWISIPYLKQHIATHNLQRPFQCDVCKKNFKLKRVLRVHKKIHCKNLDFICKSCGYMTYSKNILLQHEKRHSSESIYKCEICTRTFSSKYYLQDHTMMHMGAKPHECEKCGKQYHTKGGLYMHMKTHDSNYVEKVCQGEYCDVCGKTVKRLRRHRKIHQFRAEKEEYKCDICGKCVTSRSSLKIHLRIHSGEKPYSCDICSKSFSGSKYLMVHVRSHTGEKPFTCDQCGKSFTQQGSLRIHKMSHSGEKPYKCNMCSKAFVTNTLLKVHAKSHKDE